MQISIDQGEGHQIYSYENKTVTIADQKYNSSLIITANKIITPWPVDSLQQLTEANCQPLLELGINILVLGTGDTQQFLDSHMLVYFAANHIGVEVMDTAAACRTYNVLMAEQRQVAAALIIDKTPK